MMMTVLCCMSMPISGHAQAPVTPDAAQVPDSPGVPGAPPAAPPAAAAEVANAANTANAAGRTETPGAPAAGGNSAPAPAGNANPSPISTPGMPDAEITPAPRTSAPDTNNCPNAEHPPKAVTTSERPVPGAATVQHAGGGGRTELFDQPRTRRVLLNVEVKSRTDRIQAHRQTEVSRPHHRAAPLARVKKPGRQQLGAMTLQP